MGIYGWPVASPTKTSNVVSVSMLWRNNDVHTGRTNMGIERYHVTSYPGVFDIVSFSFFYSRSLNDCQYLHLVYTFIKYLHPMDPRSDVIWPLFRFQITINLTVSTISGAIHKNQNFALFARCVSGTNRWPSDFPHNGSVMGKRLNFVHHAIQTFANHDILQRRFRLLDVMN